MIRGIRDIIDAENDGRVRQATWRKVSSQTSVTNIWYDMAVAPGYPAPKYWFDASPLVAQQVKQSTDGGIYHGPSVSPQTKYLREYLHMYYVTATSAYATEMKLMDYLLYYPSIDESTTETQTMDNTNTIPRYTDGKGVQVMAITLASRTGSTTFKFSYTNQDGVSGRTSQVARLNGYAPIGTLATCDIAQLNQHPTFIGLQDGDYGVRSIESVTMLTPDVGLFALVLVKPLFEFNSISNTIIVNGSTVMASMTEVDLIREKGGLVEIKDDAFLGFICLPQTTSLNTTLFTGNIKIIYD